MAQERRPVQITIKVQCRGYGADITAELCVDEIGPLMKKLAQHEIMPANSPYVWEGNGKGSVSNGHENGAPLCQTHGAPMKRSTKGTGWFCPRKLDDGSYCKEKVS